MKIILAVDGSRYSDWAVDLLLKLPLAEEPEVCVVHVVDVAGLTHPLMAPPLAHQYSRLMRKELDRSGAAADRLTTRIVDRVRVRWKKVWPVVEKGHVAEKIIARAKKEKADLIILGSRGLSNIRAFLIGSVSQKVATYASCSVLVVKKKIRTLKNILIAVDGSRYSEAAVRFLSSHFLPEKVHGTVLNVWNYPFVPPKLPVGTVEEKYSQAMVRAGFKVRPQSVTGHPAAEIVETVRRKRIDLVIVGTRGLTGIKQFLLGSVSHKVVKYSQSSVLIVRNR